MLLHNSNLQPLKFLYFGMYNLKYIFYIWDYKIYNKNIFGITFYNENLCFRCILEFTFQDAQSRI